CHAEPADATPEAECSGTLARHRRTVAPRREIPSSLWRATDQRDAFDDHGETATGCQIGTSGDSSCQWPTVVPHPTTHVAQHGNLERLRIVGFHLRRSNDLIRIAYSGNDSPPDNQGPICWFAVNSGNSSSK